jgi:hypothetical protein
MAMTGISVAAATSAAVGAAMAPPTGYADPGSARPRSATGRPGKRLGFHPPAASGLDFGKSCTDLCGAVTWQGRSAAAGDGWVMTFCCLYMTIRRRSHPTLPGSQLRRHLSYHGDLPGAHMHTKLEVCCALDPSEVTGCRLQWPVFAMTVR